MSQLTWFDKLLEQIQSQFIRESDAKPFIDFIRKQYNKEISRPPRIAIIGPSGVGKSSTINSLFGTSLPVSAVKAGTLLPIEVPINMDGQLIRGAKGDLFLYDMPGIDEDWEKVEQYNDLYRQVISKCDVAVWVVSATDRRIATDQKTIGDVLKRVNEELVSRLVIGVNKVDLIEPNDWNVEFNLPSEDQEKNLRGRIEAIKVGFLKVCPGLTEDRIIAYSAKRRFRLVQLFGAMLNACPEERAWVFSSRQEIADYWEMVSPKLRGEIRGAT